MTPCREPLDAPGVFSTKPLRVLALHERVSYNSGMTITPADKKHRTGATGSLLAVGWTVLQAISTVRADDYAAGELESSLPWKAFGVVAACVAGLALSVLKNPRRSTQDLGD